MSFTKVTVVGLWQQADGSPCTGTVTFRPSAAMQQAADLIVAAASVTATLDTTGHISVELDAVDDPTTLPTGVVYDVIERIHRARREYAIVIPHTATTIDLSSVAPAIPGPIVFGYALQSALNAEVTARAAGDADTLSAAETFATGAVGTETARAMTAEAAKAASTYVDAQDAATLAAADSHADSGDAAHAASSTAHPASHVTVAAGAGVTSTDVHAALGEITGMIQSQEAGDSAAVAAVAAGLSDETTRASAAEAANAMAIAAETTRAAAAEATKQAHDADLDTIAALDSTTAGALVTDGAGWIRKTYAQLKTALGLVKGDVGLGNVDNTSDASKPVSTAQAAADAATLSSAQTFATGAVGTETSRAMAAEATKLVAGSTATYANLAALPAASAHINEIHKTLDGGVYESTGSAWVQLVAPNGTYALPAEIAAATVAGAVETARLTSGYSDPAVVGMTTLPTGVTVAAANGGKLVRWVAPRTTTMVGCAINVTVASGNIRIQVFDDGFNYLGGTPAAACPAAGVRNMSFPLGSTVPVTAGKVYYLLLAADNTSATFTGFNGTFSGHSFATSNVTSCYPGGTKINPQAQGVGLSSGTSGITMLPLLMPARTKLVASDLTLSANFTEVLGYDPSSGRLFGRNGNSKLAYSDDGGTTVVSATNGFSGEVITAAMVCGAYLFVGFQVTADNSGRVRRYARTGPYQVTDATLTLDAMTGYPLAWNLVGYDDGTVLVGTYNAPSASRPRIYRTLDFGATAWTVPATADMGTTHTDTVTAMTTGSTTITDASATAADVGKAIYDGTGGAGTVGTLFGVVGSVSGGVITLAAAGTLPASANGKTSITIANANHVHSMIRLADNVTWLANIGDAGTQSAGCYISTDNAATWVRKAAFGDIRLTPITPMTSPTKALFASDQFGLAGNLWVWDTVADTLTPRSMMATPWLSNCYAIHRDTKGYTWWVAKGGGVNATSRAALFMSPDEGVTTYLVDDLGDTQWNGQFLCRVGDNLYLGLTPKRYPVGTIAP